MKKWFWLFALLCGSALAQETAWIRINQLGYPAKGIKVAVWGSKENKTLSSFELVDAQSGKVVYTYQAGKAFGAYGPFAQTHRLQFTDFTKAGGITSGPEMPNRPSSGSMMMYTKAPPISACGICGNNGAVLILS